MFILQPLFFFFSLVYEKYLNAFHAPTEPHKLFNSLPKQLSFVIDISVEKAMQKLRVLTRLFTNPKTQVRTRPKT